MADCPVSFFKITDEIRFAHPGNFGQCLNRNFLIDMGMHIVNRIADFQTLNGGPIDLCHLQQISDDPMAKFNTGRPGDLLPSRQLIVDFDHEFFNQ